MDGILSNVNLSKVTRVELITYKGREYVNHNTTYVELQLQDDERTLKVFVSESLHGD